MTNNLYDLTIEDIEKSLVWTPKVYLLGQQQVVDSELNRFLEDEGVGHWTTDTEVPAEKLIECAGRACYASYAKPRPGGNKAYLEHILDVGHGSVTEHGVFTFMLTGVSRSLTHELVRHRAGVAYSQLSQRYVNEADTQFAVPPALIAEVAAGIAWIRRNELSDVRELPNWLLELDHSLEESAGVHWLASVFRARAEYVELVDYLLARDQPGRGTAKDKTALRKEAREAARSVLPNATETKIAVTGNIRAWRHICEMRANAAADAEIRRLAVTILRVLQQAAPNLFGDYTITPNPTGGEVAATPYRKV